MRDQDLRYRLFVDRRAIDGVTARRIAAVGPIEEAIRQIELEVDRCRQAVEHHLDVGAVRWALAVGNVDVGAAEATQSALFRAYLCPIDFAKFRIERDSDAPAGFIASVVVAAASLDQCFDVRAVEVRAHHPHALAIAPIELAVFLIEVNLFRRVGDALRNDDPAVAAVEVGALDRAVVEVGDTHVGPIDMTCLRIHDDAVGKAAIGDDGLFVGPVRIHRVDAASVYFENEQTTSRSSSARCRSQFCSLEFSHIFFLSFQSCASMP